MRKIPTVKTSSQGVQVPISRKRRATHRREWKEELYPRRGRFGETSFRTLGKNNL